MMKMKNAIIHFGLLMFTFSGLEAATVVQGGSDIVAFEAENSTTDNSFDDPALGWIQEVNSGASGGFDMVSNEHHPGSFAPPNNELIFSIDFDKTGSYDVWGRLQATTRTDLEFNHPNVQNNDSFHMEDGTIGSQSSYFTVNGLPLSNTVWLWFNLATVNVGATGVTSWHISNREDGAMLDRFIFQHADDSTPSSGFDALANSVDGGFGGRVPEPDTGMLLFIGIGLIRFFRSSATARRREKSAIE